MRQLLDIFKRSSTLQKRHLVTVCQEVWVKGGARPKRGELDLGITQALSLAEKLHSAAGSYQGAASAAPRATIKTRRALASVHLFSIISNNYPVLGCRSIGRRELPDR